MHANAIGDFVLLVKVQRVKGRENLMIERIVLGDGGARMGRTAGSSALFFRGKKERLSSLALHATHTFYFFFVLVGSAKRRRKWDKEQWKRASASNWDKAPSFCERILFSTETSIRARLLVFHLLR
jgi:hypothetical protein